MAECFICGISDEKALLFDVVSEKGIIRICRHCNAEENLPLIKKFKERDAPEFNKRDLGGDFSNFKRTEIVQAQNSEILDKQNKSLREVVERNFEKQIVPEAVSNLKLVDNFHWIIMRARRGKKLTQSQFAREIKEPEIAISTIEQGKLPQDALKLILKIENALKINILDKEKQSQFPDEIDKEKIEIKKQFEKEVSFDPLTTRSLTISDLKELKEKKEKSLEKRAYEEDWSDKTDLTDEEIDKILFGR